jgi:hypothetical protein
MLHHASPPWRTQILNKACSCSGDSGRGGCAGNSRNGAPAPVASRHPWAPAPTANPQPACCHRLAGRPRRFQLAAAQTWGLQAGMSPLSARAPCWLPRSSRRRQGPPPTAAAAAAATLATLATGPGAMVTPACCRWLPAPPPAAGQNTTGVTLMWCQTTVGKQRPDTMLPSGCIDASPGGPERTSWTTKCSLL